MYLMTCTRPEFAYPLSLLARYVAPGRHRKVHWDVAKRVLRYLCSTSGMELVLGEQGSVVLTGHSDASWADDQATRRSSQGYTFCLGSGSVSWRSTRSSSVLGSSCEAEIYAGAMATQELRWLTYLLSDLGSCLVLLQFCTTKHIALRYFLAHELQQRRQLRLSYVASQANTSDVLSAFPKALGSGASIFVPFQHVPAMQTLPTRFPAPPAHGCFAPPYALSCAARGRLPCTLLATHTRASPALPYALPCAARERLPCALPATRTRASPPCPTRCPAPPASACPAPYQRPALALAHPYPASHALPCPAARATPCLATRALPCPAARAMPCPAARALLCPSTRCQRPASCCARALLAQLVRCPHTVSAAFARLACAAAAAKLLLPLASSVPCPAMGCCTAATAALLLLPCCCCR
ncbi:unnamed protein product [Closterium sp. NIES-53]